MTIAAEEPLINHLIAFRKCLIRCIISLLVGFVICIFFAKDIYDILAWPLMQVLPKDSHFITTHPFEAWLTYFKTALIAGLFLACPLIFYFIWSFISPGLYKKEKGYTFLFVTLTTLFFVGGAMFGYYFVFPAAFEYFTQLTAGSNIVFLPQMKDYLGFTFRLLLAFGIIFELPIIVVVLSATGIVPFKNLVAFQKYMIVVSFLIAAFLTPPDVITQILMGIPMIALYELGLLFAWFFRSKSES